MEKFKKIATIIGVAVMGYFGFYLLVAIYILVDILFSGKNHQAMPILTAIIAVVIYLWKTHKQQGRR